MYDWLLNILSDFFGKIVFKVKNINLAQKGEVIFDFNGKSTIYVGAGGIDMKTLENILGTPGGIQIDGANIIDETLDASLKLANRTINEVKIELGAIKDELVANLADIDGSKFKAGTIVADKLYSGAVMAYRISALNIRTDQAVITGTAQIQDAIITNAKIQDLSVAKLISGTISTASLTMAGSALIQSSNFISGTSGYSIKGDGSAEFANIIARGSLKTGTSGQRVEITSANNKVQIFNASGTEISNYGYGAGPAGFNNILWASVPNDGYTGPLIRMDSARDTNTAYFEGTSTNYATIYCKNTSSNKRALEVDGYAYVGTSLGSGARMYFGFGNTFLEVDSAGKLYWFNGSTHNPLY